MRAVAKGANVSPLRCESFGLAGMRFRSGQRLRRTAEYRTVREKGRRLDGGPFLCFALLDSSPDAAPLRRFGVIASKRVGNAVRRNRAKRRARELFRLHQEELPPRCDLVMICRSSFADRPYGELRERFLRFCSRLRRSVEVD